MYLKTKGLVIRVTPYNDTDSMLTLLTPNHGKLSVKARGLRRKNSPLIAPCQLLAYGEFTLFEDKEQWADSLALFDQRNYSWTIWNYKSTVTGWWTTSWGVYTCQLKAITENEDTKCNIATCTYEEYVATCEKVKTENCVTATLYDVIKEYNKK